MARLVEWLMGLGASEAIALLGARALACAALVVLAVVVHWVARRVVLRVVVHLVRRTRTRCRSRTCP